MVTWWAGFVWSHLCRTLLNQWHEVLCLDNLFTGAKENIADLLDNKKFTFIFRDVTEPFRAQVDEIYNLACPASPIHYQKNPIETTKTSILWAINMLELATKVGAKILQASTSEVYGDPLEHPQTESYWWNVNPIWMRSCYDEGKRAAETLFMDYYRSFGTKIKIVRIFNTYGPYMHPYDGRVVSNFILQALTGKDITIYGDGSQTRSFQYVDDLITWMISMMNHEDFIGPVNIGTEFEYTIKELAEKICEMTWTSLDKIVYKKLPQDDPKQRKPNNTLAYEKLSWKPTVPLELWLQKTIVYFQDLLQTWG